jgi:hypothetical protein
MVISQGKFWPGLVCMYACMYVFMHAYHSHLGSSGQDLHLCMYVCMYVFMHAHQSHLGSSGQDLHLCMYVCMYVFMHAHQSHLGSLSQDLRRPRCRMAEQDPQCLDQGLHMKKLSVNSQIHARVRSYIRVCVRVCWHTYVEWQNKIPSAKIKGCTRKRSV